MDESCQRIIKEIAEKARNKVKGGKLFGYSIDPNNPDELLAAIVLMIEHEAQRRSAEEIDRAFDLFGLKR